ncbi:PadR family transcriptional regulator [Frigoribacterium sp. CG_9.8]|uniref:PadR family transcriptional regulator n=1 Tax=Frigoribacterium sp. CG_9.8 TaxID=2787733 RepID=UPI0018CBA258|nr:PadR family transcriptional regulator [Frigoribacterium sp. CG_9.8]MBG6108967.1 DNA-binding PadR family transcriptional regulator [Frigoribacterium sp. CG_9.8]
MTETTFWILTALAAGKRHGYALLGDVERLSGGTVKLRVTTLYASLDRLDRDGRIRSAGDEIVDGRARRYYEILDSGRNELVAEADRLASRAAVAKVNVSRGRSVQQFPAVLTATV